MGLVPEIKYLVSCILYLVSCILYLVSCILYIEYTAIYKVNHKAEHPHGHLSYKDIFMSQIVNHNTGCYFIY